MFYASRTLPNTFALCLVFLAYSGWLRGRSSLAIWWLTVCAAIFRFETAILLGGVFLVEAASHPRRFGRLLLTAVGSAALAVSATVLVDSHFWGYAVWPEASVFYFNIVQNRSAEWGTLPWSWYFRKALPNALLLAYPFALFGLVRAKIPRRYALPSLVFLAVFSCLPHKELRFVFYIIPTFNMTAASAIDTLYAEGAGVSSHAACRIGMAGSKRRGLQRLLQLVFAALGGLCLASSIFRAHLSSRNYPGGEAMMWLQAHEKQHSGVRVHIDVDTAVSGCSRFLELRRRWVFEKTEGLGQEELRTYTHLLAAEAVPGFRAVHTVRGFSGIRAQVPRTLRQARELFPYIQVRESDKIHVLQPVASAAPAAIELGAAAGEDPEPMPAIHAEL